MNKFIYHYHAMMDSAAVKGVINFDGLYECDKEIIFDYDYNHMKKWILAAAGVAAEHTRLCVCSLTLLKTDCDT